jgi:hypothetical protein
VLPLEQLAFQCGDEALTKRGVKAVAH